MECGGPIPEVPPFPVSGVEMAARFTWCCPNADSDILSESALGVSGFSGFSKIKKKIIGAVETNLSGSCFMHQCWLSVCFCH